MFHMFTLNGFLVHFKSRSYTYSCFLSREDIFGFFVLFPMGIFLPSCGVISKQRCKWDMIQIVEREMAPATEVSQRRNSGMGMVDESTPLTDFIASTLHEITVKKKKSYVARLLKENIESIKCVQELTTVRHKVSPGANIIRTLTLP